MIGTKLGAESMTRSEQMAKNMLADSIWKSAGIEGLGTTFPATYAILHNIPVTATRDEVLFVINMNRAWKFLFDSYSCDLDLPYLRHLNSLVLDGFDVAGAGDIRNYPVRITGTNWIPDIPSLNTVQDNLKQLREIEDPVIQSIETFLYVSRTQMSGDGNKRVAQLACNKILLQHDAGMLSIAYDRIQEFMELLVEYYESCNSEDIVKFLLLYAYYPNPDYIEADMQKYGVSKDTVLKIVPELQKNTVGFWQYWEIYKRSVL